ncbi:hypothetical protein [Streptomyces sp. NBC_01244]|uniref:hypothetical protein n=1 Tax=Streptomyces sp. NBC_01244 TaxID=2903797 RepID=UPI002E15359C|nr:hypothetical protein OG247_31800 [Streptomyces sp. NBC_01244]
MQRPPELTEEEWADYRQCQAEENTVLAQVVDREAQLENGLIDSDDEYDFSWDINPAPDEQTWPSRLEVLAEDFLHAKNELTLLDEAGHVPEHPLGQALLDQARHAQGLAATAQRAVSTLPAAPGLPPAMTTAVLVPLSAAAAHAASAVQHFAAAAAIAAGSSGRLAEHLQWRIVFHHADGRPELGQAAETSLTAATEFTGRAELRRQLLPRPVSTALPPTPPVTASSVAPKRR